MLCGAVIIADVVHRKPFAPEVSVRQLQYLNLVHTPFRRKKAELSGIHTGDDITAF